MNPTSPTMGEHRWIPLAKLHPSPLNHRKHFDQAKMDELTANVAVQGVIVPIIARPNGDDSFEIVAGERRYRAAKAAKLDTIQAIVRDLTDAEALELQVIENNQRVDVHPLEEAEGYEALMNCARSDGTTYSVDEIAAKVGKKKGSIYGRLKLLALGPEGRQAFYDGKLDASRALLLARIPVPELQLKALGELTEERESWRGEGPMTYREAAEHIQDNYMLRLKEAPFKTGDAELLPAAGACTTCPKRSGNQPELFADIANGDVCTDPKCFSEKRLASMEQMRAAAIAKGKEVVAPRAKGYVKLDDRVRGDPKYRTYREILGKDAPAPAFMPTADAKQEYDKPKLVEVIKRDDVKDVLEKKIKQAGASRGGGEHDYEAQRQRGEAQREQNATYRRRLFTHIVAALPPTLGKRELLLAVESMMDIDPDFEIVDELLLPPAKGKKSPGGSQARLKQVLPQLDEHGLCRLMVALDLSRECDAWNGDQKRLERVAELYGVDPESIKATLKAEAKAAEKASSKKKPEEAAA